jgi:hypothetical protein
VEVEVESWGWAEVGEGCAGEHCWSELCSRGEEKSALAGRDCAFLVFWGRHVKCQRC